MSDTTWFYISDTDLARIQRVTKRLFTEERLDGNSMRDLAQTLDGVSRSCAELPVAEESDGWSPRESEAT